MMTRMQRFGVLLWCVLAGLTTWAQPAPAEYEQEYQAGLQALGRNEFARARSLLGPLTYSRHTHDLAPLAHYFYALASLKNGQPGDARRTLRQALERFPRWNKRSEAYYLLGHAAFAENDLTDALKQLNRADDPLLDADVATLKINYLSRMTDLAVLRRLQREYPDDALVATYFVNAVRKGAATKADADLAERLTRRFGEKPTGPAPKPATPAAPPVRAAERGKKAVYNVAVLFPFKIETLDALNRADGNQYAVDLYEGIRLAAQKLSTEGTNLNIQAYDLDNDAAAATALINNAVFQQTDLIIGPFYLEPHRIISDWATAQGIPLVNPTATNRQLIAGHPVQYLARPSWETQGRQAAEFVRRRFGKGPAVVVYGGSRADSLLAFNFHAALTQAKDEVLPPTRLAADRMSTWTALQTKLGTRRPAVVFIALTQRDAGPTVLSTLRRSTLKAPVLMPADAFDLDTSQPSDFGRDDVYLLEPDFIDIEKPTVREYRRLYFNRIHNIASRDAMLGYDLMLFFGRQLGQHGTAFPKNGLGQVGPDSLLLGGFDYRSTNDNQAVPILRYDGYRFETVK
jgi:ABC-type branched-subunit amino acid transport system substrate-binding protein